jgi:hypothetical protein
MILRWIRGLIAAGCFGGGPGLIYEGVKVSFTFTF